MSLGETYFATVRREPTVVSYWRLDDSAGSSQAQDWGAHYNLFGAYNGSPTLGPPLIQSDLSAASYKFGGAGQNVSVGDAVPLRVTGDLSIEAWIVPYAQTQTTVLVGKMSAGGTVAAPYFLGLTSGVLTLSVGNGTTSTTITGGTPRVSIPSHVVATSFRGTTMIYLNGSVVASGSLGGQSVADGGQSLYVGSIGAAAGFNGLISEVALYSGALSARRVARHFTLGQQVVSDPAHVSTVDPPVYS